DSAAALRPWLARVARNLASNFRRGESRRRARELPRPEDEEELDPARLVAAVDAQRALSEALLRLDEPLRSAGVLRYFRSLDSAAIPRLQGVPARTGRSPLQPPPPLL